MSTNLAGLKLAKSAWPIFVLLLLNLITIACFELSFDEAYYWIYSKYMAWGYYDHPPMVASFIKVGTALFGQTEFGVRVVFVLAAFASLLIISKEVRSEALRRKFYLAVLILPLILFSGIIALPDTAILFFTTFFFYSLKKYLKDDCVLNQILVSISISGMFYSKYHGLMVVLLTILALPRLMRKKSFWTISIMTFILYLPHLYWQYSHDFISFKFHLTGRTEKHFDLRNVLDFIIGQVALLGGAILILGSSIKKRIFDPFERVLVFNSYGFILFLFLLSFRNTIEANWSLTSSVALLYLVANSKKDLLTRKKLIFILPLAIAGALGRVMLLSPKQTAGVLNVQSGRLHEVIDWKQDKIRKIEEHCGKDPIVADTYQIAAKLSFYLNREIPALHLHSRDSQYSLLEIEKTINPLDKICFVIDSRGKGGLKVITNYSKPLYLKKGFSLREIYEIFE